MHSSTPSPSRHSFRTGGHDKVYHLHVWEKALLVFAGALLIFQPWALGGLRLWAQYIAAPLALGAFVCALIPRHYNDRHHAGGELRLIMWPKLLRFPFFWLGLLYFAFVLIQIHNPAFEFSTTASGGWRISRVDYIEWLPYGIKDTPIDMMNGWRTLLIQGTCWLALCALWVGITRRKSVRILLNVVAINGTVLALVVLLQRLTGTNKLLWLWEAPTNYFAGSFTYKNHAGAFFVVILAVCLGLAWWHMVRAERELRKSNPGMLYVFLGLIVFTALAFTYARAATALGAALLLVAGLAYTVRLFFRRAGGPPPLVSALTSLLGVGFLVLCVLSFSTDSIWRKFERLTEEDTFNSITLRQLAAQATFDMGCDSPWFGHGAGSFRFLFPKYQQAYPEIWRQRYFHQKSSEYRYGHRLFWAYAHNDYAQLFAENGLIGIGLLGGSILLVFVAVWRDFAWRQPALLLCLAGPGLVAINAWVDFPFHNPAILVGSGVVIVLSLRWAALSRS